MSRFDERWKTPVKQMICETEREHTMDLIEVPRDSKLKEADVTRMKEVRISINLYWLLKHMDKFITNTHHFDLLCFLFYYIPLVWCIILLYLISHFNH